MMKTLIAIISCMFLIIGCANSQNAKSKDVIEQVNSEKFKQLIDAGQGIVLDVRTLDEYKEAHIRNATLMNVFDKNFEEQISSLPKDKEVYVYCAGGGRSNDAAEILQKNGFKKVYNLKDGLDDWINKGYPVEE